MVLYLYIVDYKTDTSSIYTTLNIISTAINTRNYPKLQCKNICILNDFLSAY